MFILKIYFNYNNYTFFLNFVKILLGGTMYDYNFEKEKVIKEKTNLNLKFNKKYFLGSVLLASKNILIFFDANKDSALKGSGVQVMPEYALLAKIPLKELKYTATNKETLINDKLTIYNFNLKEFIKK